MTALPNLTVSASDSCSFRAKSVGAFPANEDESLLAEGFTVVDATAGLRWKRIEAGLDVQNLFKATWREVQLAAETRLAHEPKAVTGIHCSPGWPRIVMARATLCWNRAPAGSRRFSDVKPELRAVRRLPNAL